LMGQDNQHRTLPVVTFRREPPQRSEVERLCCPAPLLIFLSPVIYHFE
jgi:hypothetical protein